MDAVWSWQYLWCPGPYWNVSACFPVIRLLIKCLTRTSGGVHRRDMATCVQDHYPGRRRERKRRKSVWERTKDRQKQREAKRDATHIHTDFPLCRNLIPSTVMTRTPTDPNHDLSTRCHDRFTDYINKALLAGKTQFLGYFRGWETSEVCALVQPTHRKVVLAYF